MTRQLSHLIKAIIVVALFAAAAPAQGRSDVDAIREAALSALAKAIQKKTPGATVVFNAAPTPTIRGDRATITVEELRGMRSAANKSWTDRIVHTLNLEKKGGVWTVTTGTTRVP